MSEYKRAFNDGQIKRKVKTRIRIIFLDILNFLGELAKDIINGKRGFICSKTVSYVRRGKMDYISNDRVVARVSWFKIVELIKT